MFAEINGPGNVPLATTVLYQMLASYPFVRTAPAEYSRTREAVGGKISVHNLQLGRHDGSVYRTGQNECNERQEMR